MQTDERIYDTAHSTGLAAIASHAEDSGSSSPAIPLTTPMSSPEVVQLLHNDVESRGLPISNLDLDGASSIKTSAAISIASNASSELANSLRVRLAESRLLSPSSPALSPHSSVLAHSYYSPRPEPESHEGSLCASSDPSCMQESVCEHSSHFSTATQELELPEKHSNGVGDSSLDGKSRAFTLHGSATSADGAKVSWVYIGAVNAQNLPEGKGTRTFSNGEVYEGMWFKGLRHGVGRTLHADGAV